MSRLPEQRLWDRIRKNIVHVHIERIENSAGYGTPDTLVIHNGYVLFVEHKVALPPTKNTTRLQWKHPLTPAQRNWHRVWEQNGGSSCILVGVNLELFALPGRMVDYITNMPFSSIKAWRVDYNTLADIYSGRMRL